MDARVSTRFVMPMALALACCLTGSAPVSAASAAWSAIDADAATVGRDGPAGCFDSRRGRFVLMGGSQSYVCIGGQTSITYPDPVLVHDLLANVGWQSVVPTSAAPRFECGAAAYDSLGDRIWFFGGRHHANTPPTFPATYSNTVYEFDPVTSGWSIHLPTGTPPVPTAYGQVAFDPAGRRLYALGGRDSAGNAVGGAYVTSLANPGEWRALSAAGPPPAPRWGACVVFDPDSNRVLIVAGRLSVADTARDVWSLDVAGGGTWRPIATTGTPPAGRCWGALDRRTGSLIVISGQTSEVRVLDLRTRHWSTLAATGIVPTGISWWEDAAVAFDATHRRFAYAWPTMIPRWCIGPSDAFTEVIDVALDPPLAVGPDPQRAAFRLDPPHPTPARGRFFVTLTLAGEEPARVEVFDLAGRRALVECLAGAGEHTLTIDARRLPPGLAFVRATVGSRFETRRVMVLR
jgi:hypothetical protein